MRAVTWSILLLQHRQDIDEKDSFLEPNRVQLAEDFDSDDIPKFMLDLGS